MRLESSREIKENHSPDVVLWEISNLERKEGAV